ncbi:hypothetical protein GGU11DRAFT_39579 [Lentinula aff. detonsa]|nr:hypothetical protein GGU11DRAFT_39579 [Lentinula aff. detonsa]
MLSSLPPELLYKVGNEAARLEDRKSLRLTCNLFAKVFKAHVLAEVTLNIHGGSLNTGIGLLQALVDHEDDLPKVIRTLYIDSLSPFHSFESDMEFEKKQRDCRLSYHVETLSRSWVKTEQPLDAVSTAENKLRVLLEPALQSLCSLQSIRWQWLGWKESEWTLDAVVNSLSTIECIEEYTFHYEPPGHSRLPPHPPFPDFCRLQTLSVSGIFFNSFLITTINRVIIPSTSLTSLELSRERSYQRSLHLNVDIPSTISSVSLLGFMFDFSQIIHSNLTSLELGDVFSPSTQTLDTKLDALWDVLSSREIHLRSLILSRATNDFTKSFLNYLHSYSGLEVLSFRGPWAFDDVEYDAAADRFHNDVLPMHAGSLVKLEVRVVFESRWCFGEHNIETFRRCRRLRNLWIKVNHRGLEEDPTPYDPNLYADKNLSSRSFHPNSVHLLLQMILTSLPDLEKLTIEPARNPDWAYHREDGIWNLGAKFCLGIRRRVHASVKSFVAQGHWATASVNGSDVRSWVRVYVGNERVVIPKRTASAVPMKKSRQESLSVLRKVIEGTKNMLTV